MKVIKPTVITDAMLISSTAPETDYAAWNAATNYTVGSYVIRTTTHRIYKNLVAGVDATLPENATAGTSPRWEDVGPTNRMAMFDNVVGTSTALASPLTVVLQPGGVGGLALMALQGRVATVTQRDAPSGAVVFEREIDLDGSFIDSVYDWFFADYQQLSDVVLTDLPYQFVGCELTISITGTGTVACGVCKLGQVIEAGDTELGPGVEIVDYSRKETDKFGRTTVVERAFSKRVTLNSLLARDQFGRVWRQLAALRGTPCIYIATEIDGLEPLIAYGYYRGFGITVQYLNHLRCALTIEGLI